MDVGERYGTAGDDRDGAGHGDRGRHGADVRHGDAGAGDLGGAAPSYGSLQSVVCCTLRERRGRGLL